MGTAVAAGLRVFRVRNILTIRVIFPVALLLTNRILEPATLKPVAAPEA